MKAPYLPIGCCLLVAAIPATCAQDGVNPTGSAAPPTIVATTRLVVEEVEDPHKLAKVVFSRNGRTLVAGAVAQEFLIPCDFMRLHVFDVPSLSRRCVITPDLHRVQVKNFALSPDGQLLAVLQMRYANPSEEFDEVQFYQTQTGEKLGSMRLLERNGGDVSFSPDGRVLAAGGEFWEVSAARRICRLEWSWHSYRDIACSSFSPNGHLFAAGGHDDGKFGRQRKASGSRRGKIVTASDGPSVRTQPTKLLRIESRGSTKPTRPLDARV